MQQDQRVFSEQEVAEIVIRAAKLQESAASAASYQPGVSRTELERAAAEVGIAPEYLDQAIRERLSGGEPKRLFGLLQEEQRVVDGEIDPDDFDLMLEHIRVWSSRRAPTVQIGRTLRARAFTGSGVARVEVTSRNGRTRIGVKPIPAFELIGTFYPAFIATMMSAGPLTQSGHSLIAALVAAGSFLAALVGFSFWSRKSKQAANRLADKLQSAVAEHLAGKGQATAPRTISPDEPSLDHVITTD